MAKKPKQSAAYKLLAHIWANTSGASRFSWERLNHAMRNGLTLAIGAGMQFAKGDFDRLYTDFRAGRWIGESDEWCYALAVTVGNRSAIMVYEAEKGRKPLIADEVCAGTWPGHAGYLHRTSMRQHERLAVGFTFRWKGVQVKVTSMQCNKKPAIACLYPHGDVYPRRPLHRYRITAEAVAEERKRKKLLAKLEAEVPLPARYALRRALGNPIDRATLDAVPMRKLMAVAQKFLAAVPPVEPVVQDDECVTA